MNSFSERLDFDGDFTALLNRVVVDLHLGSVIKHKVIEVGFEDYNIKLETPTDAYVVKIFSKHRTPDEIQRNAEIVHLAIQAGINHPPICYYQNSPLYTEPQSGLQMIVMKFVAGKTFYGMSRSPNDTELIQIATQAVKINNIDYSPSYLFDSWAIPNMKQLYEKTKDHLNNESQQLIGQALRVYDSMPFDQLPTCFVHGDIIKSNVIKGDDGEMYTIDFSVANTYPRIQELAVMAANLLAGDNQPLSERAARVANAYFAAGGTLTAIETENLFNYTLLAAAMEYMGSINERLEGDDSEEIAFWEKQGIESLRESL